MASEDVPMHALRQMTSSAQIDQEEQERRARLCFSTCIASHAHA